jgi:hypothetical protein
MFGRVLELEAWGLTAIKRHMGIERIRGWKRVQISSSEKIPYHAFLGSVWLDEWAGSS